MTEKIIEILNDIVGADEGEIQPDTELFESGVLDSFGLVQLVVALENEGKKLDLADLDRSAVSTPEKLAGLLR